jgi:arylsulfatase
VRLRLPKIFNLRTDPYEFAATTSNKLLRLDDPQRVLHLCSAIRCGKFAETFKDFPAVQKPNSFTIDDAMAKMSEASSGG